LLDINLRWKALPLPSDLIGGLLLFGLSIVIFYVMRFLYTPKGFQATPRQAGMSGGGGGDPMVSRTSTVSVGGGGAGPHCTRKGGTMLCPEVTKSSLARRLR